MDLKEYKEAGRIAAEALLFGKKLVKEDVLINDVVRKIEQFITDNNAKCAFPVSIALNNVAAHKYYGVENSDRFFEGDLVKLDVGVHVRGFIADNAITINVKDDRDLELIRASKEALREALNLMTPGRKICEVGKAVEEVIVGYGFNPIRNLSGHEVEKYLLHAGLTIPNFDNGDQTELEEGQVFAVEPFSTTGIGKVYSAGDSGIYRIQELKSIRLGREVLKYIYENYRELPFTKDWLKGSFDEFKLNSGFRFLLQQDVLHKYSILSEKENKRVSQSEHTVVVMDKPIVLTKI